MSEPYTEWHHCLNPEDFQPGSIMAWQDKRSETGWACGIVVESDFAHLRVKVKDITAANINKSN